VLESIHCNEEREGGVTEVNVIAKTDFYITKGYSTIFECENWKCSNLARRLKESLSFTLDTTKDFYNLTIFIRNTTREKAAGMFSIVKIDVPPTVMVECNVF
ncbi:hypothetical protein BgiBS90_018941, partial [Biomphalaria glabrata]